MKLPEAKIGLLPGGLDQPLAAADPLRQGVGDAARGDPIDAHEAPRRGLLNYVVPEEQSLAKATELAQKIAANGPLAVRKIKEGIVRSSGVPLSEALRLEGEVSVDVLNSRDAREGPRAFEEKRPPRFTGA